MKSVKESGLPVQRTIRLMIETTEETGGEAFDYYKERNSLPDHNIVLDSRYPAVIAEKGPGYIDAYFPQREVPGEQSYISEIQGSLAGNQISSVATAIIRTIDPTGLKVRLDEQIAPFVAKHGGDFGIEVIAAEGEQEVGGDMATSDSPLSEVKIVVTGTSAHGSRPEEGVNPVPRLTLFLLESGVDLQDNHFLAAAKYVNEIFGLDYLGSNLGIAFSDDFMGPLTAAPTYFGLGEDGKLRVAANIRVPRGELTVAEVIQKAEAGLAEYRDRSGDEFDFSVKITDWMYRDPQGAWLETLLNVFGDTTGLEAKPIPTSGSTTAKQLPNAINFGPSMPGQKYMGHNANEFKFVENLYLDLQMFTEMMARIANLENLD
jgi:acetylornithine deacetylase/succinyl-diaminopimelate desuccinylase-like protein